MLRGFLYSNFYIFYKKLENILQKNIYNIKEIKNNCKNNCKKIKELNSQKRLKIGLLLHRR